MTRLSAMFRYLNRILAALAALFLALIVAVSGANSRSQEWRTFIRTDAGT